MPINIPNILTVIRILLVPLFVIYLQEHLFIPALIVFTIAGLSDGLDGFLARYLNQRTSLGAYLDPIADKLLLASAFIYLAILGIIPSWLTVIVISRDILILLGVAIYSISEIKVEIKPSIISKFTTVTQLSTIFISLLNQIFEIKIFHDYFSLLFLAAAALTIASGLHYTYKGLNIQQNGQNKNGG